MKRYLMLLILALFASISISYAQKENRKEYVEVMYFHGKQRCVTCQAIEKYTKELLEKDFANEMKQGKVKFKVVDISTEEGEKIAEKYKVTWSSLFVNKWKNGKEVRNDLTQLGFQKARTKTAEFKSQLKDKINDSLK